MSVPSFDELEQRLSGVLNPHRFRHTLGVSDTAAALAMAHGADVEKARLAGYLHDCAKYLKDDEIVRCCEDAGIGLSETELAAPWIIHAVYGAYLAETLYGVKDPEILGAVRWHTTGKPGMSLLEKIIFTADYIEPCRKMLPGLPRIRGEAFQDLDLAVFHILEDTDSYLNALGRPVDPHATEALSFYRPHG